MSENRWMESPNVRPGEPLRLWTQDTAVRDHDAIFTVRMAEARLALEKLIAKGALTLVDQISLAQAH